MYAPHLRIFKAGVALCAVSVVVLFLSSMWSQISIAATPENTEAKQTIQKIKDICTPQTGEAFELNWSDSVESPYAYDAPGYSEEDFEKASKDQIKACLTK